MEYLHEAIALGVDVLVLGLCLNEYYNHKNTLAALKKAPQLQVDRNLKEHVKSQTSKKVPYAVIRGTVKPIGSPIHSVIAPSVTGVVQTIKLSEHRIARGFAGFWTEQRKLIHSSSNEVPFKIVNGDTGVEIIDALSAEILDLDVIHDSYEPSSLSFFDHVFGFFSGIRQRGLQTTEEILREGSFITAVGELELDGDSVRLQPTDFGPMFLTTATKATLIRKFEEMKTSMMIKVIVCGTIGTVLTGVILRKFYIKKKQEREERRVKLALEQARRERVAKNKTRTTDLSDEQKCVVCKDNPKEVICLPCGHVCLCEECSGQIHTSCPVCRTKIDMKSAAFIS